VKLLFDQNLSPRLVEHLSDLYPVSAHVHRLGLDRASDTLLWEYAREHGFALVTQDADFSEMSEALGFPPKVIWIRRGNCSTSEIESTLRQSHEAIVSLDQDTTTGILTVL
jgi:predicted nuclease of predicted toxin-antitoxin system